MFTIRLHPLFEFITLLLNKLLFRRCRLCLSHDVDLVIYLWLWEIIQFYIRLLFSDQS